MRAEGYKVNGYDAAYCKTMFSVTIRGNGGESCVLEVTDIEAGVTFIVPLDEDTKTREIIYEQQVKKHGKAHTRTRAWKNPENNDRSSK
jgi:hypothetical protein